MIEADRKETMENAKEKEKEKSMVHGGNRWWKFYFYRRRKSYIFFQKEKKRSHIRCRKDSWEISFKFSSSKTKMHFADKISESYSAWFRKICQRLRNEDYRWLITPYFMVTEHTGLKRNIT